MSDIWGKYLPAHMGSPQRAGKYLRRLKNLRSPSFKSGNWDSLRVSHHKSSSRELVCKWGTQRRQNNKIDVDEAEEVAGHCGIQAMPTFQFYKNGEKLEEMRGADVARLEQLISKYKWMKSLSTRNVK